MSNGRTKLQIERDKARAAPNSEGPSRDRRLRTKRSVERDKGGTRNTGAQTSRQEAQAVELIRRAFATSSGRLWDDVSPQQGFKSAHFDGDMLQRQNVNSHWPYPQSEPRHDRRGRDRNSNWGDDPTRDRSITQWSEDGATMNRHWQEYDRNPKGRQPSAMRSSSEDGMMGDSVIFADQSWQPDPDRVSDYNDVNRNFYAALSHLLGI